MTANNIADRKHMLTIGYSRFMVEHPQDAIRFIRLSFDVLEKNGAEPSMTVGYPSGVVPRFEDEGRTVILGLCNESLSRLFACRNELGGYTFMLASEY